MADKNQLKAADPIDFADDDPFAELTRIMGFDPRQPARRPEPAPVQPLSKLEPVAGPAEGKRAAAEEDFSLDLEKELLGDFDFEDNQFSEPDHGPSAQAQEADFVYQAEPAVDFDFGDAFEADSVADASQAYVAQLPSEPDLDAAFASALQDGATDSDDELNFDLGLTHEEVLSLNAGEAAPVSLPVTPQQVASDDAAGEVDLDAAMADIDMSFLDDRAPEPAGAAPLAQVVAEEHSPSMPPAEAPDFDLNLFDDADFRLADESVQSEQPLAEAAASEELPEIDLGGVDFGALEVDRHAPQEAQPVAAAEDEFSLGQIDFGAEIDQPQEEPEPTYGSHVEAHHSAFSSAAEQLAVAAAEPNVPAEPTPSAKTFEFAVPPYVPRKLPTSPMDVAAEEYRLREAAEKPAEPHFNLEDELNALLGNVKPAPAPVETQPVSHSPAAPQASSEASPFLGEQAYRTTAHRVAPSQPEFGAPEQKGFEGPENPADIDDNLKWELEDAFASESLVEDRPFGPRDGYDPDQDVSLDAGVYTPPAEEFESRYAGGHEADEDLSPINFDSAFDDLAEEPYAPATPVRDFAAGAALGAATARFGHSSGPASFGFGSAASASPASGSRVPERFASSRESMTSEQPTFSPHRDPVVRGNPMAEDPLDIITQLAEKYSRKEPEATPVRAGQPYDPFSQVAEDDIDISDVFMEHPEVETIEVNDQAIALADDLDIPELPEDEDVPVAAAYDDLDSEFSSLLSDMNSDPSTHTAGNYQDPLAGGFSARPYETRPATPQASAQAATARPAYDEIGPDSFALDAGDLHAGQTSSGARPVVDEYDYDPDFEQEIAPQYFAAEQRQKQKPWPRGLLVAGIVGGVALVGAIGAFALSFGGSSGADTPTLVKADEGPVKVRPENPGGTTVPNQDNKVYDTVAGQSNDAAPQQETLVTTAEDPIDVAPPAVEDEEGLSASGKSEDRIEQIVQEAEGQSDSEIAAVAPRKVRTMVVKPDGTLVPREDEPELPPSDERTDTIAAAPVTTATGAAADSATPDEAMAAIPDAGEIASTPESAPLAPLRPAEQPVDVVGEVAPTQVAAATTAAAAAGGWAMQIASQPSEAAAQSSYKDLVQRYGSVLQGREVNIVKAEIAGKGTFWRVRVPAPSRNEAISLCESYKSAGGNCFVSR
ncbi:MAG: SPOR domain-containing protein [Rhizobiaceae bacterium]|nr:SPOR domain-containing protein [Rhizobiaceae bacterium]